jgi:hypothetical protein
MHVYVCVCVYACMHMCVCERFSIECTHTHIYTFIHTCIHTYIHTYIHTFIHTRSTFFELSSLYNARKTFNGVEFLAIMDNDGTSVSVSNRYIHVCNCEFVCTYICTCICTYIHVFLCVYIRYTNAYTHTHTHIH